MNAKNESHVGWCIAHCVYLNEMCEMDEYMMCSNTFAAYTS